MTSDDKKKSLTRQQQTAAITPSIVNAGTDSRVVKGNNRAAKQGRAGGGNFLAVTAPLISPDAPEDTLIDVDAYGDGVWRFDSPGGSNGDLRHHESNIGRDPGPGGS